MISECPHCRRELKLTEAQLAKIKEALSRLTSGTLKVTCPLCRKAIDVRADDAAGRTPASSPVPPEPPPPQDLDWLINAESEEKGVVEDIPLALILMADGPVKTEVAGALEQMGYKAVFADSAADAIERMRFVNFAAVVLASNYEGRLEDSAFHAHMRGLAMAKRRYIYYILIGPEFHTLYDLEALAKSANLVINDKDINRVAIILKKGLQDYQNLFGPWIEALRDQGKN